MTTGMLIIDHGPSLQPIIEAIFPGARPCVALMDKPRWSALGNLSPKTVILPNQLDVSIEVTSKRMFVGGWITGAYNHTLQALVSNQEGRFVDKLGAYLPHLKGAMCLGVFSPHPSASLMVQDTPYMVWVIHYKKSTAIVWSLDSSLSESMLTACPLDYVRGFKMPHRSVLSIKPTYSISKYKRISSVQTALDYLTNYLIRTTNVYETNP